MILSDIDLMARGEEIVEPFHLPHVQPASIDFTLGKDFLVPTGKASQEIDLDHVNHDEYTRFDQVDSYLLLPQAFILGRTEERVKVPVDVVGRVEGKSSLARLGLLVHVTAGYLDPGFEGTITLEFYNVNRRAIRLRPGRKICQVSFVQLTSPAAKPYGHPDLGSKYQNQELTTGSRYGG